MFPAPPTPLPLRIFVISQAFNEERWFSKVPDTNFLIEFNNHMTCDQADENKNAKHFEGTFMLSL